MRSARCGLARPGLRPRGAEAVALLTTPAEAGSRMQEETVPFWQLFYHFVWTTKNREPFITVEIEPALYSFMSAKAVGLGGRVFALNGTADHVHLAGTVPPRIAVAQFIGQVKGVASAKINQQHPGLRFAWQEEYGVFSFDEPCMPRILRYVQRQKEHHRENDLIAFLERTTVEGVLVEG